MELIKREKLLFNFPINIPNLGTIYQPKIKDFINKDFDMEKMIRAFSIDIEKIIPGMKEKGLTNFDFFLVQLMQVLQPNYEGTTDNLLINELSIALKILYRTDNIKINLDNNELIVDDKYSINRESYDVLCKYIKIIFDIEENKKEEKTKEQKDLDDIFEKRKREFEERRKKELEELGVKEEEKEGYNMYDYMDYIIHCDNTIYDYESILELTIYQIKNTFIKYRKKENYETYMKYKCGGFKMDFDEPHWFFNKK